MSNNKIATIILNRNLPKVTNKLYQHLKKYDGNYTDIYVLEAGSDIEKMSKYCTWHENSKEAYLNGLRYCRGMNLALLNLSKEKKWNKYEGFFLITNDTELSKKKTILPLVNILKKNKRIGIISPCSKKWGEKLILNKKKLKFFWFIHNNALLLRRSFVEDLMVTDNPTYLNFLFDGTNFRGYQSETELIAKGYVNDWASAITSDVFCEENESYLIEKSKLIKTDNYNKYLKLYLEEGNAWLKSKYGFNSKWSMQFYVKAFYDQFFVNHPELIEYKIGE